jgi:hypothetical protein
VKPIAHPLAGEVVAAVHPPIAPRVDAGWRRRLNLFTGRTLSDTALTGEQQERGGRLATSGQTVSRGVVAGLQAGLETVAEPLPPEDRRNPDAWPYWEEGETHETPGGTLPRAWLHVAPGFGLAASGEDVGVDTALRVPVDELWVYLTPGGGSGGSDEPAERDVAGAAAYALPPPGVRVLPRGTALSRAALPRSVPETAEAGADTAPLGAPVTSPPEFRGPLWTLWRDGTPLPPVAVLVLQPVVAELAGDAEQDDPCEQDPSADAFADLQVGDGCRLVLYAWPYPDHLPDPARPTWRNELAELVFRFEAAQLPGELHPWEEKGVPLGLVGFDQETKQPRWVDAWSVVRDGGRPLTRRPLVTGVGDAFLWQARMQQFTGQVAESDWTAGDPAVIFGQFRFLPPAGLLPREAADASGRPRALYPPSLTVDAVPVPTEQLDVALEASASLTPFDLGSPAPDALRVLVPVPGAWYEPRLLLTETVAQAFQDAVDTFVAHRRDTLERREDLHRKAEAVVGAIAGKPPLFPRPELDPNRLEDEGDWTPSPRWGLLAHDSPLAQGTHGHGWTDGPWVSVVTGDTLFAWVHLNPVHTPVQVALRWSTSRHEQHWAWWGDDSNPMGISGPRTAHLGPLPVLGEWVRLEVPADAVGLQDHTVKGIGFYLSGGYATWDRAGLIPSSDESWWDENVPAGATFPDGAWEWVAPDDLLTFHGYRVARVGDARLAASKSFNGATATLAVRKGDALVVDVRLDPARTPTSIMVQWNDEKSWDHRAWWGADDIPLGRPGTPGHRYLGPLPPAGEWTRLVVPAALVGLEGSTLKGMALTVNRGFADWDRGGVRRALMKPPGTGLTGQYFRDTAFTDLKLARVDGELDLLGPSQGGRFDPVLMGDVHSIRWTGQIVPRFTESYEFVVNTPSGSVKLWVEGVLLIDTGNMQPYAPNQWTSGWKPLTAGTRYNLRIDFVRGAGEPALMIAWDSDNQQAARLHERYLYPSATAGGDALGPPAETAWVDDATPPGAQLDGGEGWTWVPAPVIDPPEDDYETEAVDNVRVAIPLEKLRASLEDSVLTEAERAQLDARGVDGFAAYLDAKVRRADDWIDFGFMRVQADMYRLRQLMVGATAASRLATSPTLAAIINNESAVTVREGILAFLDQVRLGGSAARGVAASGPPDSPAGEGDATLPAAAGEQPLAVASVPTATRTAYLSSSLLKASFVSAEPRAALTTTSFERVSTSLAAPTTFAAPTFVAPTITGTTFVAKTAADALQPTAAPAISVVKARTSFGGSPIAEVIGKSPIVGETYDFRTVTVGERMQTPPSNEAKSFAMLTRFEVLGGLARLDLALDDLMLPGFVQVGSDGKPVYRTVTGAATQKVPVREPRKYVDVKGDLAHLLLQEPDPPDADESVFYSIGVELLDATIAALRTVEGRLQQYRDALADTRAVLEDLRGQAGALDRRLKQVEDDLAEARHDVSVSRALLAEETERVAGINQRRAAVLREHVRFLAFQRPRLVHAADDVPVRTLDPAYTQSPVPAALADPAAAPPEIRALTEMLREAPVRWFPAAVPLVDRLDRLDVLLGTLASARQRAATRLEPVLLESTAGRAVGKLGEAIDRRLGAQKQVVSSLRRVTAGIDLSIFRERGWKWTRDRAVEVLSLGDLIDAAHGRSEVDRGATRLIDEILRVSTALYHRFGEVLPVIRLEWAERLSEYDDASVELRNLYSLPRWSEVPYLDRRDLQSLVDWLYGRVDPARADAVGLVNDVVHVCLLLASHAPVSLIIAGEVQQEVQVKEGATVALAADLTRVHVGMPVLLYDPQQRPIHGIVEDLADGMAQTRILKTPQAPVGQPAPPVVVPKGTRAQFGEAATLGTAAALAGRTPERDQSRARTLAKVDERRVAVEERAAPAAGARGAAAYRAGR